MPDPVEQPAEFGPKIPPLEGVRDTISELILKLTSALGPGLELNDYVRIKGNHGLVLRVEPHGDGLVIGIDDPRPRLNVIGWLKGYLTQIKVTPYEITVVIDGLPDLKIEILS